MLISSSLVFWEMVRICFLEDYFRSYRGGGPPPGRENKCSPYVGASQERMTPRAFHMYFLRDV